MPELPEVQTTVDGLQARIAGLTIADVWTDYNSAFHTGKDSIKDPAFFKKFRKEVVGKKIVRVSRRAKNILIHISSGDIILIHMKMTGHILYGKFVFDPKAGKNKIKKDAWTPAPDERKAFHDPFNKFIHFVMTFSPAGTSTDKGAVSDGATGKKPVLAFSDMRKFAKVTLVPVHEIDEKGDKVSLHLQDIGPDALDPLLTFEAFKERINRRPNGPIKTVMMDQSVIAGVGNIYSDEALWRASINPEEKVKDIPDGQDGPLKKIYEVMRAVLLRGIDFGGDSMSDYRNIDGERGKFQEQHNAYRKTGKPCTFMLANGKICPGIILRKVVNTRSAHFCSFHQQLLAPNTTKRKTAIGRPSKKNKN